MALKLTLTDGSVLEGSVAEILELQRAMTEVETKTGGFDYAKFAERITDKAADKPCALDRRSVVAKAKRDIIDLRREGSLYDKKWEYRERLNGVSILGKGAGVAYNAEFIVNREKQTVVVLLKGYNNGALLRKAVAKTAPGDVFNADIGKAIALRRALGLEVPREYTHAPQPEGVAVGDRILRGSDVWTVVNHRVSVSDIRNKKTCVGSMGANSGIVIDDTDREEYRD